MAFAADFCPGCIPGNDTPLFIFYKIIEVGQSFQIPHSFPIFVQLILNIHLAVLGQTGFHQFLIFYELVLQPFGNHSIHNEPVIGIIDFRIARYDPINDVVISFEASQQCFSVHFFS